MTDLKKRKEIARELLSTGIDPGDLDLKPDLEALPETMAARRRLHLPFPDGLAPVPLELPEVPDPDEPLPRSDILVITWTVAENNGLADVLTPGFSRKKWYRYRHRFDEHYQALIRTYAPAQKANRLGSWFFTQVGTKKVMCFKSELHLNQDGIKTGEGTATLPVKGMFKQLIDEVKPGLVITTGTSGGVFLEHDLGDVVVTRGAKFRLADEFKNEPFNGKSYRCEWDINTQYFEAAKDLMVLYKERLIEPAFAPPTKRYKFDQPPIEAWPNNPDIKLDGKDEMSPFHPILTTDFFEFGTSANHLEEEGCAVDMGDAVLGLACEELDDPPLWVVARNISDPQINADLPTTPGSLDMQVHWAVWYYQKFGYWTSVNGALAVWALLSGFDSTAV